MPKHNIITKQKPMKNVSQKEWTQLIESDDHFTILDVRTPKECIQGMQQGAQNLNFLDSLAFMDGLEKLDKTKTYYVYCRSGGRSSQACAIMEQEGFKKTYNLLGGMLEWKGKVV